MSSPSVEPCSSSSNRPEDPNRHGSFNLIELQRIFRTVEQDLPEENADNFWQDDIRWDLGNPQDLVIHRRESEGSRSLFDVQDVVVNAVADSSNLRLEREAFLRQRKGPSRSPREPRRSPRPRRSPTARRRDDRSGSSTLRRRDDRGRSPTPRGRDDRDRSPTPRRRDDGERSRGRKRKRSPSRSPARPRRRTGRISSCSSCSSCEGCEDPNCGKEYIELTEEVKRCLIEHPVLGKGFFIRDPADDAKTWYTPGLEENYVYPTTYDVGATHAIFNPYMVQNRFGEYRNNRFGRGRSGRREFGRSFRRYGRYYEY